MVTLPLGEPGSQPQLFHSLADSQESAVGRHVFLKQLPGVEQRARRGGSWDLLIIDATGNVLRFSARFP